MTPPALRRLARHGLLLVLPACLLQSLGAQSVPDSVAQRPVTKLGEIVTTASRVSELVGQSPVNVTTITRRDLATTTASTVPSLLWRIPGFTMRDHQSASASSPGRRVASFRGLSGSSGGRTLILVDGVPLNDGFNGYMQWNRIPLALVDRVEVIRGGGSMIWGSRSLGGVERREDDAVDADLALVGAIEARDQVEHRRLARAGLAEDRDDLAARDREVETAEEGARRRAGPGARESGEDDHSAESIGWGAGAQRGAPARVCPSGPPGVDWSAPRPWTPPTTSGSRASAAGTSGS